jgi:hypothetical protein
MTRPLYCMGGMHENCGERIRITENKGENEFIPSDQSTLIVCLCLAMALT